MGVVKVISWFCGTAHNEMVASENISLLQKHC